MYYSVLDSLSKYVRINYPYYTRYDLQTNMRTIRVDSLITGKSIIRTRHGYPDDYLQTGLGQWDFECDVKKLIEELRRYEFEDNVSEEHGIVTGYVEEYGYE